ncbi:MAG TPA: adenosine kinase [Aliidongia sp.]|nr:adenosine kinase [Aliidongia sp.]
MATSSLDVVGIGNAIVDIIAHADDAFLKAQGMTKASMALIDEARAEAIYAAMGPGLEMSGGSAGNTIAGIASLGGKAGYIGKVRDDLLGKVFRHDITSAGVVFTTPEATDGPSTARSMILVTPDAQRTMNTFLGACVNLRPEDVDDALIESAQVTYLEGYLFDPPHAQEAFRKAARTAHAAGRKVSLSLSDGFCVNRHRPAFLDLVEHHVDILFANEAEITALFETDDFDKAVTRVRGMCELAAVTRGAEGSVLVTETGIIEVPAAKVSRIVDTTGAGDLYAAGVLHGITTGRTLPECGRLGSLCAAEIISHYGARPETPLKQFVGAA